MRVWPTWASGLQAILVGVLAVVPIYSLRAEPELPPIPEQKVLTVAVLPFSGTDSELVGNVRKIILQDLATDDRFRLFSMNSMVSDEAPLPPEFRAWRLRGVQFVVRGSMARSEDGKTKTVLEIWDITGARSHDVSPSHPKKWPDFFKLDRWMLGTLERPAPYWEHVGHTLANTIVHRVTKKVGGFGVPYIDPQGQRKLVRSVIMVKKHATPKQMTGQKALVANKIRSELAAWTKQCREKLELSDLHARIRVKLDSDGRLVGEPMLLGDYSDRAKSEKQVFALFRCAYPSQIPPNASTKYTIDMSFR